MTRLFIVDPSLKDLRGHHYALTRAATVSAQAEGFDVSWLCSAQYEGAPDISGVSVDPAFRSTMYDRYMLQGGNPKPTLSARFARIFGRKEPAPAPSQETLFREDLEAALGRRGAGAGDRLLLHTADGVSLRAMAALLLEGDPARLPVFHVATPYNPTGIMPNKGDPAEIETALAALAGKGLIDSRLFLYGENAPLARHLAAVWSVPVRALNLPVVAPAPETIERANAWRRDALNLSEDVFLIVSLGSARLEKGFDLFPEIIRETFARAGDIPNIKYVLHASPQIIGRHPKIAETIDRLNAMPREQVELILEPLSDADYENLLCASDAVMMPYTEKDYKIRGSMIVSEAAAAGKAIIATANTYPGDAAKELGGWTAVAPHEFAEGALKMALERDAVKEHAARAGADFVARNTIEGYWKTCLAAEAAGDAR